MSVFEQCKDATETWQAFYTVACLCDQPADMQALCGQARHALGADWPWDAETTPLPYDIFCKMGDYKGGFDSSGWGDMWGEYTDTADAANADAHAANANAEPLVRGYDPAAAAPYSSIVQRCPSGWGRVELVSRAAPPVEAAPPGRAGVSPVALPVQIGVSPVAPPVS